MRFSIQKNTIASRYPTIKKSKWEKEVGKYEIVFIQNKIESSVLLGLSGNLLQFQKEIPRASLPKEVLVYPSRILGKEILMKLNNY